MYVKIFPCELPQRFFIGYDTFPVSKYVRKVGNNISYAEFLLKMEMFFCELIRFPRVMKVDITSGMKSFLHQIHCVGYITFKMCWNKNNFLTARFDFIKTAQKVDGKTLVLLSKRASQEQYEACGLLTVADQLKLSSVVNSSAECGSTGFEVTTITPKKPTKAQLQQISETARRIYKTK